MQPLAILFGAAFTAAVSFSFGAILLRNSCPDFAVRFVCGAAILSSIVFATAALGVVYPATFLAIGVAAIAAAWTEWRVPKLPRVTCWSILFVPYLVLYFFNAMAPEISYDGSRYHLGLVSRYLREHGFHPITDNFYAALTQGVEMLYLFAFSFGRHSAAALVHFTFLIALVWQLYGWCRRRGFPLAGVCAAALVFISPMVGVDGTSAYNDVAVAAIAFTLFHILDLWDESRSPRLLVAAGLLAGFAFAAKYTAFLAIPYAIGFVLWKTRQFRPAVVVTGFIAVSVIPWLLKNYLWFQNPLAPLFNQVFPNPYVTVSFENEYTQALRLYTLHNLWEIPIQVTTFGSLGGLLGPVLLLSPLALLSLRIPEGRRLLFAALVFGATYFSNIGTRFLLPAFPFIAAAFCLVLTRFRRISIAILAIHAIISWPAMVRRYCRPDAWHLAKVTYREALRIKPEVGFLESNLPLYGITRRIDEVTPADAVVFTEVPIPEAYTSRKILVSYQSAANIISRRVLFTGFVPEHLPKWRWRFTFPPRVAGAIRLVQTAQGNTNWTLHEVRAFDGAEELSRSGWRGTAQPYPWGIDAARDGRLTSFWMCGSLLNPGQFAQFEFPAAHRVDSVLLESAPDQPEARIALELRNENGRWERVPELPAGEEVAPPPDLRRQVSAELKRRGIGYLLAFDGQFGADDLRDRAGEWGIRQVTEYKGARLYQLP